MFTEPAGGWTGTLAEAAKLLGPGGSFQSVAVSTDTAVVGAIQDDFNTGRLPSAPQVL